MNKEHPDTPVCPLVNPSTENAYPMYETTDTNTGEDIDIRYQQFKPFQYFSNYFSINEVYGKSALRSRQNPPIYSDILSQKNGKSKASERNEQLLKKYYESKKMARFSSNSGRNNISIRKYSTELSTPDSQRQNPERNVSLAYLDEFLKNYSLPMDILDTNSFDNEAPPFSKQNLIDKESSMSYFRYMEQLSSTNRIDDKVLKRHQLWTPSVNPYFDSTLFNTGNANAGCIGRRKLSPFFVSGQNYIPKIYNSFSGSTLLPSIFSEQKLPSFMYQSSIVMGDNMFIYGGLVPSYRYDGEAPNLEDFEVDGIDYLPPPLMNNVINNPCMVGNPYLYVVSTTTNHVQRPTITGQIPPVLLCATSSPLNDRYILFFGGFEIRTESRYDPLTYKYYLRKRAFVNNVGYILDTKSFNFTKVEILLGSKQNDVFTEKIANFAPRFGHVQVSIKNNNDDDWRQNSDNSSNNSSSFNSHNNNNNNNINSVLLFGGYKQIGDDEYEAMNDLWKIDIQVISRGKRGYIKFSNTVVAKLLAYNEDEDAHWPSKRAFMGSCVHNDVPYSNYGDFEKKLLENLENNFKIDLAGSENTVHAYSLTKNISNVDSERKYKPLFKKNEDRALIIHGGSNNTSVFGDLWWFDLQDMKWEKIELYGRSADDDGTTVFPIDLKLVSHSIVINGDLLTLLGGLNQKDVDVLFNKEDKVDDTKEIKKTNSIKLEDLPIRYFDLNTQSLFDRKVVSRKKVSAASTDKDDYEIRVNITSETDLYLPIFFGGRFLATSQQIILIGGLYGRRTNIHELYLRGTMVHIIVPNLRLAV